MRSLSLTVASEFCRVPNVNEVFLFVPSGTLEIVDWHVLELSVDWFCNIIPNGEFDPVFTR